MGQPAISIFLQRYLLVLIVAVWIYHLSQRRRYATGERKRRATFYFTILLIGTWAVAFLFARYAVRDIFLVPLAVVASWVAIAQRRRLFPYRLRCASCGKPLPLRRVLFHDANTCPACEPDKEPEKENAR
jgi:hypothetical protein